MGSNRVGLFIIFLFFGLICFGQNTRSVEAPKPPKPQYQAFKKEKKGFFSFLKKHKRKKTNKTEVEAFRERIQDVYKEKAKEERLANKKRYRKQGYFGHKKPPKKRPAGKQKFCEVCKIKH